MTLCHSYYSAAALEEIILWLVLTIILSIANSRSYYDSFVIIGCISILCFLLIIVIRPLLAWIVSRVEDSNQSLKGKSTLFAAILVLLMICAWSTEFIGVHPILGSFLCGTIIPVSDFPDSYPLIYLARL